MMKRITAGLVLCAMAWPAVSADLATEKQGSLVKASLTTQVDTAMEYQLGAGDVLHVSVWKNEDLSRTVTIRPDGKISLPLIGELTVAGLTPAKVQAILVKELVEYVDAPERNVFVIVEEVNSYQISVLGEVKTPGRFAIQGNTMVLDALSEAGGLTEFASESEIVIFRRDGNGIKRIPYNYKDVIAGRRDQELFFVQPGDVVLVP